MLQSEYQEFASFMRLISKVTTVPNGKSVDETIDALFVLLEEYPFTAVKAAVMKHCEINKFFPMLADIVNQIKGTPDERALLAWGLVLKASNKYRLRESIRFPIPAIHFAIEQMEGWAEFFKTLTPDNKDFRAKTFMSYYKLGEKIATWENVCEYFPSDGERCAIQAGRIAVRRVYDVATDMIIPDSQFMPLEPLAAWSSVRYRMAQYGARQESAVSFKNPAVNYAVEQMGGWQELCATVNDGTDAKKLKEFRLHYMAYSQTSLTD